MPLRSHLTVVAVVFSLAGCSASSIDRRVARRTIATRSPSGNGSDTTNVRPAAEPKLARPEETASLPPDCDAPPVAAPPVAEALDPGRMPASTLYLLGRSAERQGDLANARECYVRSLEAQEAPVPSSASLAFLHALARECLQHTALRGNAWREVRTAHFLIFREADSTDDEPLDGFERARAAALQRLGFDEAEVPHSALVPVFVFEGHESFERLDTTPVRWAGGCAAYGGLGDRLDRTIYIVRGSRSSLASTVRHEIAHVFVGEAHERALPGWAIEGVAVYAEDDDVHEAYSRYLAGTSGSGAFTLEKLNDLHYRELSSSDACTFYARSYAVFDTLVQKTGSVRAALRIATAIANEGPSAGLARSSIDLASFEREVDASVSSWGASSRRGDGAVEIRLDLARIETASSRISLPAWGPVQSRFKEEPSPVVARDPESAPLSPRSALLHDDSVSVEPPTIFFAAGLLLSTAVLSAALLVVLSRRRLSIPGARPIVIVIHRERRVPVVRWRPRR